MATPSDDSSFLCVLFSNACMAVDGKGRQERLQIEDCKDELVLLTGQQLGGIRFEAVKGKN